MGTLFAVTVANSLMYHHEKYIIERYSRYLTLYKQFIDNMFAILAGLKESLLEFLDALNNKAQSVLSSLNICASDRSISFLQLFFNRDTAKEYHIISSF